MVLLQEVGEGRKDSPEEVLLALPQNQEAGVVLLLNSHLLHNLQSRHAAVTAASFIVTTIIIRRVRGGGGRGWL